MALDGNYSTLNRANSYFSFQEGISSRILVGISAGNYAAGITAGDVIRWDTGSQQYEKSKANTPYTAEVFGIVESYSAGDLYVVVNGSINLNPDKTIIRSFDNTGGNDVFFLSGNNLGFIENVGPTFAGYVIKPIYQVAPHGNFTGIVRNYLGYRTNVSLNTDADVNAEIISFSDDMSRMISYSTISQTFYINTLSYSNNTFTRTTVQSFSKNDVPPVTFLLNNTHDCKVSNNGKDVLIFSKSNNKIYYINLDTGTPILKQTLSLDVVGSVEDKIWACDDELSSMTISSRSLSRTSSVYDTKITSHDASSRILFFKRNMNSLSPYKWRQTHENHAFAFCDSNPREYSGVTQSQPPPGNDSLFLTNVVSRTCDITNHGKNFILSTQSLIEDQQQYSSKITGRYSQRYTGSINGLITKGTTYANYISDISPSGITVAGATYQTSFFGTNFIDPMPQSIDNPTTRKYKCNFGIKNYKITNKNSNYYYEDLSHREPTGMLFYMPYELDTSNPFTNYELVAGITLDINVKELSKLTPRNQNQGYVASIVDVPTYEQNAIFSSVSCMEDFALFSLLYEYINTQTSVKNKKLIIGKLPFYANDNLNTFRYYEPSSSLGKTVPSSGNGFGVIASFYTTSQSPAFYEYSRATNLGGEAYFGSIENPTFSNDVLINSINIDNISYHKIFTSNERFYLCISNKTLIWNYSTSSYNILNTENTNKAKFYSNSNGDFFIINDKILRYDQTQNSFIQQEIL